MSGLRDGGTRDWGALLPVMLSLVLGGALLWGGQALVELGMDRYLHLRLERAQVPVLMGLREMPEHQRSVALNALEIHGKQMRLETIGRALARLPDRQRTSLLEGERLLDSEAGMIMQRLDGGAHVLSVGMIANGHGIRHIARIRQAGCVVVALVALGLPALLLVWSMLREARRSMARLAAPRQPPSCSRLPTLSAWSRPLRLVLRQMEQQVRARANRQSVRQSVMGVAMAHELRTPLARIRFGVGLLQEGVAKGNIPMTLWRTLGEDLQHMQDLIASAVEYSQLAAGRPQERRALLVEELLAAVVRPLAPPPGRSVTICCPSGLTLWGNEAALSLAVRNLVANALRHACSRIVIHATASADSCVIRVEDDGAGIAAVDRQRVFEPYVRLDRSQEGFGLGLAMVKAVMEQHGGTVGVSASPLGGACLQMLFPNRAGVEMSRLPLE